MRTQTLSNTTDGMVKTMRAIREEISKEIEEMTFEEERAYLDHLLMNRKKGSFDAIAIDNEGFKFDRNKANER